MSAKETPAVLELHAAATPPARFRQLEKQVQEHHSRLVSLESEVRANNIALLHLVGQVARDVRSLARGVRALTQKFKVKVPAK